MARAQRIFDGPPQTAGQLPGALAQAATQALLRATRPEQGIDREDDEQADPTIEARWKARVSTCVRPRHGVPEDDGGRKGPDEPGVLVAGTGEAVGAHGLHEEQARQEQRRLLRERAEEQDRGERCRQPCRRPGQHSLQERATRHRLHHHQHGDQDPLRLVGDEAGDAWPIQRAADHGRGIAKGEGDGGGDLHQASRRRGAAEGSGRPRPLPLGLSPLRQPRLELELAVDEPAARGESGQELAGPACAGRAGEIGAGAEGVELRLDRCTRLCQAGARLGLAAAQRARGGGQAGDERLGLAMQRLAERRERGPDLLGEGFLLSGRRLIDPASDASKRSSMTTSSSARRPSSSARSTGSTWACAWSWPSRVSCFA